MMWNVVLGVALMLWAFGYAQTRQLLSRTRRKQAQSKAPGTIAAKTGIASLSSEDTMEESISSPAQRSGTSPADPPG
jgi:hypothetical protein